MNYWVVMAIVVIAIIAVMIAIELEPDEPNMATSDPEGRPIWVALGSSARPPDERPADDAINWVELIRQAFGDRIIAYDFTRFGATANEVQRDLLDAALATNPDIVTLLIGPDDFRDAEDINVFERRLWHILSTLNRDFVRSILTTLPDLTTLPSLAAEDDAWGLAGERASWNVAITRLAAVAQSELVDVETTVLPSDTSLFSEASGRFVLTEDGHRWFATLMIDRMHRLLGDVGGSREEPPDQSPHSVAQSLES
jgi:hypothetical protein